MLLAKMNAVLIFTDNSGLLPETYAIETNEPVDKITVTTNRGEVRTLQEEIEAHSNIISLTEAIKAFGIKCAILRIEEITICYNNIHEEEN